MISDKNDVTAVGLIILAAGASKRMGKPKQLLPYQGKTLLQNSIEAATGSLCNPIVLVLGANYAKILPEAIKNPIHIVKNHDWKEGMSSTIRVGLSKMVKINGEVDFVVVLLWIKLL